MGVLNRIWYALIFILIVGLFFYDNVWWLYRDLNIGDVDRETQVSGKIVNISEDHFYIYTGSSNLRIESSNTPKIRKARYGETVVHVLWRKNGTIEGLAYHNYDYNYVLYLFSFIALLMFLIIFFREWKLTSRGFENA